MKKQILFLAMFTLALIFAGTTNVFGQSQPSTQLPEPLTGCLDGPLHPLPGVSYDYSVLNPLPVGGLATSWSWWATKNPSFIDATGNPNVPAIPDMSGMLTIGNELIAAGQGASVYGTHKGGTTEMSITWGSEILSNTLYHGDPADADPTQTPTFIAVMGNGDCTNNLQVYEINPIKAFTLDIANIAEGSATSLAYGTDIPQCVDVVQSAVYNPSTYVIDMDYGKDTLYFEIIAANFVTSWIPTFQIMSGLDGTYQEAEINWAYTMAQAEAGNFIEATSFTGLSNSDVVVGTTAITSATPNTATGVSIFARVIISNNEYQSLVDAPFVLAVDGQDASAQWDIDQAGADCTELAADQTDQATQTLTPRPTINDNTGETIPGDDTFIPKNQ